MFTGLIEKIGILKSKEKTDGGVCLTIEHDLWKTPLSKGESVAVSGICFTVARHSSTTFCCDVLNETLERTNLDVIKPGNSLNLERALKVGDHIGGHFVSGHVDGVAELCAILDSGRDKILRFKCDDNNVLDGMVIKGSVACDGVSLTISALLDKLFEVNVIPFTWTNTTLAGLIEGNLVNIETDMLGKYVRRNISDAAPVNQRLDINKLRNAGFVD